MLAMARPSPPPLLLLLVLGFYGEVTGGFSGRVDVTSFGAIGDGVTDDHAAISAALVNLTASGGGELFFPPGRFGMSAPLVVTGYGVRIVGSGAVPTACIDKGTALVALTTDVSLVVFQVRV